MLVKRGALDGREVESDGRSIFLVFAPKLMLGKVSLAQVDQVLGRDNRLLRKDLRVDMTAELLNPYFIIS